MLLVNPKRTYSQLKVESITGAARNRLVFELLPISFGVKLNHDHETDPTRTVQCNNPKPGRELKPTLVNALANGKNALVETWQA